MHLQIQHQTRHVVIEIYEQKVTKHLEKKLGEKTLRKNRKTGKQKKQENRKNKKTEKNRKTEKTGKLCFSFHAPAVFFYLENFEVLEVGG